MFLYVLSIKPEYRGSFTPHALKNAVRRLGDFRIVEGEGRRTITVEASEDSIAVLASEIPQASVRPYRSLPPLESE